MGLPARMVSSERGLGPLSISTLVHAAIVAVIAWVAVSGAQRPPSKAAPSMYGSSPEGGTQGAGVTTVAPTVGRSLQRSEGEEYVGRYHLEPRRGQAFELRIRLINDAAGLRDHWSLLSDDSRGGEAQKLIVVSRDTFAYQFGSTRRVIFLRVGGSVVGVELRSLGQTTVGARNREP
jgi:hypothetical protein